MNAKNLKGLFSKLSGYGDDAIRGFDTDIAVFNNLRQNALDVPVNLSNNTVNKLMGVAENYGNPIGFGEWSDLTDGIAPPFINEIVAHSGNKKLRNWLGSTSHNGDIMTPEWLEFLNEDIF